MYSFTFMLGLVNSVQTVPWSNAFWPGLTPFGPPMWQAEADTELTLSASPTTAVGQKALALAKRRYSTVLRRVNLGDLWRAGNSGR